MTVLQAAALLMTAAMATAVVLVHDPTRQVIVMGVFGLTLTVLFFAFQAPDVGLSEIVVGSVALPAMVLLTLARLRQQAQRRERERAGGPG